MDPVCRSISVFLENNNSIFGISEVWRKANSLNLRVCSLVLELPS